MRALSGQNLKDRGLSIETSSDRIIQQMTRVGPETEESYSVYTDTFTGERVATGPGWDFNQAEAAWNPQLDKYDPAVAQKYIEGMITSESYTMFFEGKLAGNFPVAVLDGDFRKMIGAQSQVINLSSETLKKNLAAHPDLDITAYQKLPDIISAAQLVVQDGDQTIVFFKTGEDVYYAAVKATKTGETNFLTSLRLARESDIEAIKRKGKVLKDEL